jgi:subtilisin family serine protease
MTLARRLAMPWARSSELYSAPGGLIFKLALGEAPDAIPASSDVRRGALTPAAKTGHGAVDRILRRFGGEAHIARLHSSAASQGRPGGGHRGFNDLEHATGLSRTFRVSVDHDCPIADLIDALRQLEMIESAAPRYLCALPFAASAGPSFSLDLDQAWRPRDLINAPEAMAYETGDPAVVVAIVDTGVTLAHPELRTRLRAGWDTVQLGKRDLAAGIQLSGDERDADADPTDEVGHGTSCAGIIGALGERIPPGLAGECSILPVRVLGSAKMPGKRDPVGVGAISDIDEGVKRAVDLGAKVINMSFGTPESALDPHDPRPHEDVVRYGLARGCVMIAASGNDGAENRYLPAAIDGVIAVGAVNADGKPSAFSTTGDHVAISAPGEQIVSAGIDGYQAATGTSFAAPFVTATCALLVSRALRRSRPLDGREARRILCESARPWPAQMASGEGEGRGSGVLDAVAALRLLDREIE